MLSRWFFSLILFTFCFVAANAQVKTKSLIVEKRQVFGPSLYYLDGNKMRPNRLKYFLKHDVEASSQMKLALQNRQAANALAGIGGFLIGYSLGGNFDNPRARRSLLIGGFVITGVGFSFNSNYTGRTRNAVKIYNKNLQKTSYRPSYQLIANNYGIGIRMSF